jgi:hypothetical protein
VSKVTPERVIEVQILRFLTLKRIYSWKNVTGGYFDPVRKIFRKQASPFAINGTSDILGVLPDGKFLAIEVKSKTGRPSPEQINFIDSVTKNNGIAFIARSIQDVQEKLREYL